MKAVMSCDEVFDVLTRGPFPSGRTSDCEVDAHLLACHECRELAEALRPAVNLFHEAVSEYEEAGLPTYRGQVEEAVRTASLAAGNVSPRAPASRRIAFEGLLRGALIGLAASIVLCLTGLIVEPLHRATMMGQESSGASFIGRIPHKSRGRASVSLASLGLPLSCMPGPREQPRVPAAELASLINPSATNSFACCTRCHFSGGTSLHSAAAVNIVTTACATCHQPPRAADGHSIGLLWREHHRRAC